MNLYKSISYAATLFLFHASLASAADPDLFVMEAANKVLVFNSTDNGNIAPKRSITGGSTNLSQPVGVLSTIMKST